MHDAPSPPDDLIPVPCPACGEAQNSLPGDFSLNGDPFGPVLCVACGREFSREEYLAGRSRRLSEWPPLRPGGGAR